MNKRTSFWGKSWWTGLDCITGGLIGLASLLVSVKVYIQTERIHAETLSISRQMNRQTQIHQAKVNVDRYLKMEWYDEAVWENNQLNDSLRAWGMATDSTCFWHFKDLYYTQKKQGHDGAVQITEHYLSQLR